MKQILLLSALVLSMAFTAYSQSLKLSTTRGDITNGDTIVMTSMDNDASFVLSLSFTNLTNSTVDVMVRKTELSIVPGSENYFCDWITCNQPSTFTSTSPLSLAASATNNMFTGDYLSHNNAGRSYVMYTFYNNNNPTDTVAVVAGYYTGSGVGIDPTANTTTISKAYPNPAKDYFQLDYNFDNANNASVEILNVVGSVVRSQSIQGLNGTAKIDISELNNGVYFYNVVVDGRKVASKKLVVQH